MNKNRNLLIQCCLSSNLTGIGKAKSSPRTGTSQLSETQCINSQLRLKNASLGRFIFLSYLITSFSTAQMKNYWPNQKERVKFTLINSNMLC